LTRAETLWLRNELSLLSNDQLDPLLNLGSSTKHYRAYVQPFIEREIFIPLRNRGITVYHIDIKEGEGIDIVMDVTSRAAWQSLNMSFRSVICTNLLEHIENVFLVIDNIKSLIEPDGIVFVIVPHKFPLHPDPIDTGYRPSIKDLASLFEKGFVCKKKELLSFGNFYRNVVKTPLNLMRRILSLMAPFITLDTWIANARTFPWMFKQIKVSCAVVQRQHDTNVD
jgi:hypothetical protein